MWQVWERREGFDGGSLKAGGYLEDLKANYEKMYSKES
jgi:hypothetical protein